MNSIISFLLGLLVGFLIRYINIANLKNDLSMLNKQNIMGGKHGRNNS